MFDYELDKNSKSPIYEQLYDSIRNDIISGNITGFMKLPSKRMLADKLNISKITVENAYSLLQSEGYIYSVEKKGYYAENNLKSDVLVSKREFVDEKTVNTLTADLVGNNIPSGLFPFNLWTKLMREAILNYDKELLNPMPYNGSYCLRKSLCEYLYMNRGMVVNPSQIVIGAGTSYLYSMIIQLLGTDRIYALENPCYAKLRDIYHSNGAELKFIPFDDEGISLNELVDSNADILHISPAHNFPTGIVTSPKRRNELINWVKLKPERYIIEDEFDSEFKFAGKPNPSMQSLDSSGKIIYINTFSKTISPSVRISYMILPDDLAKDFQRKLGFYSCTVSSFEQYTLASFIDNGCFERHINRMRKYYKSLKRELIECVHKSSINDDIDIAENDSGLFFHLRLKTNIDDCVITSKLAKKNIRVSFLNDYSYSDMPSEKHVMLVNYSGIDTSSFNIFINELTLIMKGL